MFARQGEFFLAARGLDMAPLGHLGLARQDLQVRNQFLHHVVEDGRIALVVMYRAIDDGMHLLGQAIAVVVAEPVRAGFGDGVQHLPRRMLVAREETGILQGHPHQRHLHFREQRGGGAARLHVAHQVVIEHADQVQRVVVFFRQRRRLLVRGDASQQGEHVLLEVADIAWCGAAMGDHRRDRALLHPAQRFLQVGSADHMRGFATVAVAVGIELAQQLPATGHQLAQQVVALVVGDVAVAAGHGHQQLGGLPREFWRNRVDRLAFETAGAIA